MLPDPDRAAELTEGFRRGIVCREIEDVHLGEVAECPEQWLGLAGVLLQLRGRAHAEEHRATVGDEPALQTSTSCTTSYPSFS